VTNEQAVRLGEFIHEKRVQSGLSLRRLGDRCGMSAANLLKTERGFIQKPSPHTLQRLAQHLGCEYEDLAMLAGYSLPEGLPTLPVYLRTKYDDLSDEERRQVVSFVDFLRQGHSAEGGG